MQETMAKCIIIFDSPYDPEGNQIELTGGDFQTGSGHKQFGLISLASSQAQLPIIPDDAQGITDEQKAIFASPYLSTMYIFGWT